MLALPAAAGPPTDFIPLPTGFQPEGIATGPGPTFYTGSLINGRILKGNLHTGDFTELVGDSGKPAVGMSYDMRSGYLFVAGGPAAEGRVYDGESGALLAVYAMASGDPYGDFINDVVVTREAAYFTNSFAPYLYRVELGQGGQLIDQPAQALPLHDEWVQIDGPSKFNANGIVAKQDGQTLIVVNSETGLLYQVDPGTGAAKEIVLLTESLAPLTVPSGDGLVLQGQDLYVVQNFLNQITLIRLSPDLETGISFVDPITDPLFDFPTTAASSGNSLYVVNAKLLTPPAGTAYEILRVPRN